MQCLDQKLSEHLIYPESDGALAQAIKWGSISNLPISIRDISDAQTIFGPSIASLKGKSTAFCPESRERVQVNKLEEKNLTLTIDIIYVSGEAFLVSLSNPIDYFTLKQIDSKSSTTLAKVIASIMSLYRGEGFFVHSKLIAERFRSRSSLTLYFNAPLHLHYRIAI
jgi:hypothetical protein